MFNGTIQVPVQDAKSIHRLAKSFKKSASEYICQVAQEWWEDEQLDDGDLKRIPQAPVKNCRCKITELNYALTTEMAERVKYVAEAYSLKEDELVKRILMADVYEWSTARRLIFGKSACDHNTRAYGRREPKPAIKIAGQE